MNQTDPIEVKTTEEVPAPPSPAQKKPESRAPRRHWWSSWWAIILMAILLLGSGAMAMVIWGPMDLKSSKEKSAETAQATKEFEELRQKFLDLEAAKSAEEVKRQEEAKAKAEAESKIKLLEEEAAAKAADAQKLATLLAEAEEAKAKAEAETAAKVAGEAVPGDQGLVFVPYDPAKHKVKPGSTERLRHTGEGDMPKHRVMQEAVPAKTRDGKIVLVRAVLGPKGEKIERAGSYMEQAPELEDSSLKPYYLDLEVTIKDPQDPSKTKLGFREYWLAR